MTIHLKTPDLADLHPKIAVIGVGGAGGNAVNNMIAADLQGVSFIAANTDAQALTHSNAKTIIQLGVAMTEGLGAGSKPEIGAAAAEESIEEIRSHLRGLHMVFITAGMGGGTGTGAAPVIAAAARAEGVLTVGVVTKPFHFEGQRRMRSAEFGVALLSEHVDTLIVIPNQNLFRVAVMKTTFSEAFAMADQVLHDGISCITDVMVKEGIINLDFADVDLVMRASGKAMMGTGMASGESRGREAAEVAITNPLLDDVSLHGAKGLLVSIIGGRSDLTLYEVDEAANRVREEVASDANIIIGTAFDETLNGAVRVSVVVTGLDEIAQRDITKNPGKPKKETVASSQSLKGRLDEVNLASGDGAGGPAQVPLAVGELKEQFAPSNDGASSFTGTGLLDEGQQGAVAPAQPGGSMDFVDSGVRMPSMEDFPPVGQALLREREEGPGRREPMAGLDTHKERAGFFERLAMFARVGRAKEPEGQTVANQPQLKAQSTMDAGQHMPAFMDPHLKGEALSPKMPNREIYAGEIEEDTEFPSFLRNSG